MSQQVVLPRHIDSESTHDGARTVWVGSRVTLVMTGGDVYSGVVESMTEEYLVISGDVDGQRDSTEVPWSAIEKLDKDSIPKVRLLKAIGIAGGAVIILWVVGTILGSAAKAILPQDS